MVNLTPKILIVSHDDYPHIGGKSTHISNLIDGFNEMGIKSNIICFNSIYGVKFDFIRLILIPIRIISKTNYIKIWNKIAINLFSKKIEKICKLEKIGVISVQDAFSAVACKNVKIHKSIPIILTMHTYFGLEYTLDCKLNENDNLYKYLLNIEVSCLKIVNSVIAVDTRIKNHIIETYKALKIENYSEVITIPNFTNTNIYNIDRDNLIRKKFLINDHEMIIVCVRRLVEKNGVIYCLNAIDLVPENYAIKLLIVGDGPEESKIIDIIKNKDLSKKVIMCGAVPNNEILNYYKSADCAVVPSITVNGLQEATSLSALEAMSCGLPLIASSIGGLNEMIENGVDGILVEEKNSELISNAIIKLYDNYDLRKSLGLNAREKVLKNYSHLSASKSYFDEFLKRL